MAESQNVRSECGFDKNPIPTVAICQCRVCQCLDRVCGNLAKIDNGHLVSLSVANCERSRPENDLIWDRPDTRKTEHVRAADVGNDLPHARPRATYHHNHEAAHADDCKFEIVFSRFTVIDGRIA